LEHRSKVTVWTGLEAACLIAAFLLYLLSLSGMASRGQSDPAGNAMEAGFAVILEFLLWLPLSAFVALRCRNQGLLLAIGLVLCLGGTIVSIWALGLLASVSWVGIAPIALPPLAVLYGIGARLGAKALPRLRRAALIAIVGLAAAAAVPVFVAQQMWDMAAPERAAAMEKAEADAERQEADAAARREAEFAALGPDSRLEQLIAFLMTEHEEEALAKIRALHSRQADIVRLLDSGTELFEFRRMPEFGLAVTPELCRSYRRRIEAKLRSPGDATLDDNAVELATYVDNYRWLHGNGCGMADLAARTAASLRRHPNDSVRADAATFDSIR
jgi:hypothetical protein